MDWRHRFIFALVCAATAVAYALPGAPKTAKMSLAEGRHFWSYQPIVAPTPPTVKDIAWPRNDIDRFVLAKLESRGLHPVGDAQPAVLVRRLYFDLIGLPPTPEQIDAYLNDTAPDRYARLVDRLLASPEFGQRWGRHWLDVARYGESLTLRGFILYDAWRYRDYVIDTLNHDRPFNRFMLEQVAGDLLPASSIEERSRLLVATEFLALGNINLEEQDKKQLEMDVVDEQLSTLGTAFLAQTIGCARCHDHKFDPISTRDYYAMAGILRSTQTLEHANVSKLLAVPLPVDPAREEVLKKQDAAVAALQAKITEAKAAIAKVKGQGTFGKPTIVALASLPGVVVDDTKAHRVGTWHESKSIGMYIGQGYLTDNGDHTESRTLTFQPDALEPGNYEVRFAYIPNPNRATNVRVTVASADGEKQTLVNERNVPDVDGHFVSLGQHHFEKNGQAYVLISTDGVDGHVVADAVQFIAAEAVASGSPGAPPAKKTTRGKSSPAVANLEAELKKLVETGPKRDAIQTIRESKKIEDAPVHIRGNVHSLGDLVPRGFLEVVPVEHSPAIPKDESGRRELGEWLANPKNPLPARVMANRIWHWTFGTGIVRTVDNFGTTGELPSHPELLEYLASRFVAENWSVKSLVRQIVLSHTYQLSTADNPAALTADPENRLLWRMSRRRIDAECIRDSILAASGKLTSEAGGPTYKSDLKSDFGFKQTATCRSVYLPIFRNAMPDLFEAFDFADTSVCTGRRNVSTVAPQSLFMLNSPFVIEQSHFAASRLLAEKNVATDEARIDRAYQLALGRSPAQNERKAMLDFVRRSSGDTPEDAWAQVFHALFASMDFRYVN